MADTLKLIHTADLHLDSPLRSLALRDDRLRDAVETASRTALTRIVDAAIEGGARAVLIAGDLFDGRARSARTGAFLVSAFERLGAAGIDVFAIRGNHDAENPLTGAIEMPPNVHVFDGRGGKVQLGETGVWVHGVSFSRPHAPESLLPKFAPPVPGAINIGLLHTSLAGAAGHDSYAPCAVSDLVAHGFDYWALGHVHARMVHAEAPFVVMPGMPQGRDIGEAGPKSATMIEVGPGGLSLSEVPTSAVEFRRETLDVTGAEDDTALRQRLRAHLTRAAQETVSDAAILRLTLKGTSDRAWALRRDADEWGEYARQMAEETGSLWVEAVEIEAAPPDTATPDASAVAELGRLMAEIAGQDAMRAQARAEVEDALRQLPADRRALLAPDAAALDALAADLAGQGAETLLAQMRGASTGDADA